MIWYDDEDKNEWGLRINGATTLPSFTVKKWCVILSQDSFIIHCALFIFLFYVHVSFYNRVKSKDKSDRATTEQVMDPRTRMMLFKMINRQLFAEVNGCVSTGKEANVYHACRADGTERAIKVGSLIIIIIVIIIIMQQFIRHRNMYNIHKVTTAYYIYNSAQHCWVFLWTRCMASMAHTLGF